MSPPSMWDRVRESLNEVRSRWRIGVNKSIEPRFYSDQSPSMHAISVNTTQVRLLVSMRLTVPDPASRRVLRTRRSRHMPVAHESIAVQARRCSPAGYKRRTGAPQCPISAAPSCPKAEPKTRMRLGHGRNCYRIWFRFD
jgi:hypothetical protein